MSQDQNNAPEDKPLNFEAEQQPQTEGSPDPFASDNDIENDGLVYDAFSEGLDTLGAQPDDPADQDEEYNPLTEAQERIAQLEKEISESKDKMIRAVAEAENTRRRAQKEREDASKFAVSKFSKDVLSVADNLRRALDAMPTEIIQQNPQIKNLTDGVEATERELLGAFEKNGITKIEPLDERFDPNFHEVMFEAEMPDKRAGTIIQVIEPGYTLNGRILRPARVGVSKGGASGTDNAGPGQNLNTEA